MWKLVGNPKTYKITNRLAREFAEMHPAPQDRPLSERRLQVYERAARNNMFRPVSWAKAECVETADTYRVNGKHTSTLFTTLDLATLPDLYAVVEEYTCDTLEDVAKLYGTFDSSTQSRNSTDINRMFAASIPELAGMDTKTLNLCVSAVAWHRFGHNDAHRRSNAEKAELMFDEIKFFEWFAALTTGKEHQNAKIIRRVPVAAAMRSTFERAQQKSEEFWAAVRDQTGATADLPDRRLAKFLMMNGLPSGGWSAKRGTVSPEEFYSKSVNAWNLWRKGEKKELFFRKGAKPPIAV